MLPSLQHWCRASRRVMRAMKSLVPQIRRHTKATAEGDLAVTLKDLAEDTAQLADTHHSCMTQAQDFEAATKSRGEELKALAEAKKVILEATSGATAQTYDFAQTEPSFLQVNSGSHLSTRADLANFE